MSGWRPLAGAGRRVALEVLLDGPLSRAELARRVGLSPGSLTRLTKPLLASGLLVEVPAEPSDPRVGRPSQPLDVVADAYRFAGVKLTGDQAVGVLTTLRAEVLATAERPLPDHDPAAVAATVADLVHALTTAGAAGQLAPPGGAGLGGGAGLHGIGISLGGQVRERDQVRSGTFLDWHDVGLGALMAGHTDVPIVAANDVTALTEATHWFGAGRGAERFCLLTVGAGVGYGLVVHDRPVDHPDVGLGPIGHHRLLPDGPGVPRCERGHAGCASALLTTTAIAAQAGTALGRPVGYQECLDLAERGDPAARAVVDTAAHAFGRLIAAAANFTLPDRIVLGGEGVRLVSTGYDALLAGFHADRHPEAADPPLVLLDPDFSEWARGAAVIAIQTFVLGR